MKTKGTVNPTEPKLDESGKCGPRGKVHGVFILPHGSLGQLP